MSRECFDHPLAILQCLRSCSRRYHLKLGNTHPPFQFALMPAKLCSCKKSPVSTRPCGSSILPAPPSHSMGTGTAPVARSVSYRSSVMSLSQSRPGMSAPHSSPDVTVFHSRSEPLPAGSFSDSTNTEVILQAIASCKTLTECIDHLATECNLIHHDFDKFCTRLTEAEERVSAVEDTKPLPITIEELQCQVQQLSDRVEDAENSLQRNNMRVLGLPEGAERAHPEMFLNYRDRDHILTTARNKPKLGFENTQ